MCGTKLHSPTKALFPLHAQVASGEPAPAKHGAPATIHSKLTPPPDSAGVSGAPGESALLDLMLLGCEGTCPSFLKPRKAATTLPPSGLLQELRQTPAAIFTATTAAVSEPGDRDTAINAADQRIGTGIQPEQQQRQQHKGQAEKPIENNQTGRPWPPAQPFAKRRRTGSAVAAGSLDLAMVMGL